MSDISKKILSIDPDEQDSASKTSPSSPATSGAETYPAFVHRTSPMPTPQKDQQSRRWIIWIGIILAILWSGLSASFLFLQPSNTVGLFTPIGLTISGLIILFPALALLMFCMAVSKLGQVSARADSLSYASERLLQADQSSAEQAKTLAEAIRGQINSLDNEMTVLADRFEATRDMAQAHSITLNEASSSLLSTNQTLEQSLIEQRRALESMMKIAEEKFQQTEKTLEEQKHSLSEIMDHATLSLNEAGQKLEDKSRAFDSFISESEARLTSMTEKFSDTEERSIVISDKLKGHVEALTQKISNLQSQNVRLSETLESRMPLLSSLSDSADAAKDELFGVISKSVDATDALRAEVKSASDLLSEKFQDLNSGLTERQNSTREIIKQAEDSVSASQEKAEKTLQEIEARLKRLQEISAGIEAVQTLKGKVENNNPVASTKPSEKLSSERLHLRPLEEDLPNAPDSSSYPYDLELDPLDLEADMSIPLPEVEAHDAQSGDADVVKPVTESAPLFGRAKPKEKSPWRWRDMMGGFDSPDSAEDLNKDGLNKRGLNPDDIHHDVSAPDAAAYPEAPRPFDLWIGHLGIDLDDGLNHGTVLDAANAIVMKSETISTVLWRRVPHLAEEISAATQTHEGFAEAAHHYRERLSDSINPEIMNRDAIRNRLNTTDGKLYLLSCLV
ncbi:hypothetical protein [Litorimonas haliclonae]|uniref:hypothetical protein n=1 Tax=Litorimonas haliclonae TaxID=2081977 RepID=UPI0039EFC9D8